jgi:hypothetical protein
MAHSIIRVYSQSSLKHDLILGSVIGLRGSAERFVVVSCSQQMVDLTIACMLNSVSTVTQHKNII